MHNRTNHSEFIDKYFSEWVCWNSFAEYCKCFNMVSGEEFTKLIYDIDMAYIAGGEI